VVSIVIADLDVMGVVVVGIEVVLGVDVVIGVGM